MKKLYCNGKKGFCSHFDIKDCPCECKVKEEGVE